MKKFLLYSLIGSVILFHQCIFTDQSEAVIVELTCTASYESANNYSSLQVYVRFENKNIITGVIDDWLLSLYEDGSSNTAATYMRDTYRWALCEDQNCRNVAYETGSNYLFLEAYKFGDIFNGQNPDTILCRLLIKDENDNIYRIEKVTDIAFDRN